MPQELGISASAPLSIGSLLLNLSIGVLLSLLIRVHFERFGSTLSNREEFSQVFPFVLLTTILIITVVKSSLALSLGLVGALSVVRFRTPIKEPEELAYLFIAIAIGLGLGADQTMPTVIATIVILGTMAALKWARRDSNAKNLYLSIDWPAGQEETPNGSLQRLHDAIGQYVRRLDLRRFDVRQDGVEATYYVDVENTERLGAIVDEMRRAFPTIGVTFLDQNQLPRS